MKKRLWITTVVLSLLFLSHSFAWEYPVIRNYGPVQPLPKAALQPDKSIRYKVLFDVTKASGDVRSVNPGLDHIARFINVMASAGIMPKDMDLVAIIHGGATRVALDNEIFEERFFARNANIKLIIDLKKAGVKLYVCGQALADNKFSHEWVNPEITIALSALEVVPTFQLKGYAYVPFF
jgi:intracellular sulfur oxidation DsrE/DsrF family protein